MALDFHISGTEGLAGEKYVPMYLSEHELLRLRAIEKSCRIFQKMSDYWSDYSISYEELQDFKTECTTLKGINETIDQCLTDLINLSQKAYEKGLSLSVLAD